jgi:AraC family transcriptional regulator, regulatory protein of adaptative response / methylated-DNA-[protein]-cysteine methyltransferase
MTKQSMILLAEFIEAHADETLTLASLAKRVNMSPTQVQRRFTDAMGLSPKAYQDGMRQRRLKAALREEGGVAGAIFEAGYGSTSRVYGHDNPKLGMGLKAYQKGGAGEHITYAIALTRLGYLLMAATQKGVVCVQFADEPQALIDGLHKEFPKAAIEPSDAGDFLKAWLDALEAYLEQDGPRPDLPLDLRGTLFQHKVWRLLTSLRDGETLTYAQLAQRIGAPKAVRAAASSCAANRIAVLVPCHKVLRSDGGLGGYRWGLERKSALLDRERQAEQA